MEKNSITIHQAYYGELTRSHSCLMTTVQDSDLKSFLTAFTDRPSNLPPGLAMEPYFSGISYGNNYIFTKTLSDTSAQRGGMVFTHVLIVDVSDLMYVNDLDKLFSKFVEAKPDRLDGIHPFDLDVTFQVQNPTTNTKPEYILKVADQLINSNPPVIFCGDLKNFQKMISSIWSGLPPIFRQGLSYTAGFIVGKLDHTKTIVYFQKSLFDSLSHVENISDSSNSEMEITDDVQKFLLIPHIENAFDNFLNELGVNLNRWDLLKPAVKAYQLYTKIDQKLTGEELRLLMRNIAKISPKPDLGKKIKLKILTAFDVAVTSGAESNIRALRNIPVAEFATGVSDLSATIGRFISGNFNETLDFNHEVILELFTIANSAVTKSWWETAVINHLSLQAKSVNKNIQVKIWRLLTSKEDTVGNIFQFIPLKNKYEELSISAMPSRIEPSLGKTISIEVLKRKWYLLNAQLLLRFETTSNAVLIQLKVEDADTSSLHSGTYLILNKVSNAELKDIVFKQDNTILTNEYARRSLEQPSLLENIEVNDPIWVKIWHQSLLLTRNLTHGISEIPKKVNGVLDLLTAGQSVPHNIVALISESLYADLSNYYNRNQIWKHLPLDLKPTFLNSTAEGYLQKLIKGGDVIVELEKDLNNHIADDFFMTQFLSKMRSDINAILVVYEQVDGLKDKFLADYISYYSGQINEIESLRLGKLIQTKGYNQSAYQVFEKAKRESAFKIALTACREMINLDFWGKLQYGYLLGEAVSGNAVYDALLKVCLVTHSTGPEESDLWKRAGGNSAKLSNHKTREESWRQAMDLIRNGGGGNNISVKTLINAMLIDNPNNNQLKEISKYFNK